MSKTVGHEPAKYNALMLRAEGEYAILELEYEKGKWVTLIKERLDSPFSHIIEPLGIQRLIEQLNEPPIPQPLNL